MSELMESWKDYNVAMTGAITALAGLVIVAASVNIERIVKGPALTARLAAAIATLVAGVAVSALGLFPGILMPVYGTVVIVIAVIAGVFQVHAAVQIYANDHPQNRLRFGKSALNFVPVIAYAVAGVLVLAGSLEAGLVVIASGSVLAICTGVLVSWVALVEVLR
ncbi:hypothetical protein ABCS02_21580 [Microbacterium sp. X-17]|uniref:hypothetical protein n=1 Tax=Microbacterium sp. X-17 TaxID=3144404 RepID=UPI0031F48E57